MLQPLWLYFFIAFDAVPVVPGFEPFQGRIDRGQGRLPPLFRCLSDGLALQGIHTAEAPDTGLIQLDRLRGCFGGCGLFQQF